LANFKITISDTKGKSITKELKDNDANPLLGLLIGQETDASLVGLEGKIKITGGSDKSGIPMRADLLSCCKKTCFNTKGSWFTKHRKRSAKTEAAKRKYNL